MRLSWGAEFSLLFRSRHVILGNVGIPANAETDDE